MTRYWAINGRFMLQGMTGVQRYAHEIVAALDCVLRDGHHLAKDLEIELLVPPGAAAQTGLQSIRVRTTGRIGGHLWEQAFLAHGAAGGLLSLCNTGPIAHRKQIVCIHDLNTRIVPESYSPQFRALYRALVPALGRTARSVATVSNYSSGQLERFGVCRREKVRVVPNGADHAKRWKPEHSAATRAAAGPATVVVLGSRAPHKNLSLMLALSNDMAKHGLRLAVVGAANARVFANVDALPQLDNVAWLGKLSDNELAALLSDCLCLAFPSRTEGFGLPPIEAMALGCPVVVSDRGSLPEVCGKAALYAPPDNADAWLRQFRRLRDDAGLRAELSAAGLKAAARYSWRRSAEQYLELMAECDGVNVDPRGSLSHQKTAEFVS